MTTNTLPTLLLVDDDPLIRDSLQLMLSDEFDIVLAETREQAIRMVRSLAAPPQLALVDLGLPPTPHRPQEGFRLITELLAHAPHIKILTLSGQSEESNARHARTLGAFEFIAKPCKPDDIRAQLRAALIAQRSEQRQIQQMEDRLGLVGESPAMQALRSQIRLYASAPYPVLIQGESGCGKELVAQALQKLSPRHNQPFIALNCAAIAPNLLESTLFGHAKGAFTGATAAQPGFFETAGDGTLFLDEVGELPLELQAKLLRVLENGEYQRVGETTTRKSSARIIAATNQVLAQAVRSGSFRTDLYHRLSVFTIAVPPLRAMDDDRELLLDHFRSFYAAQMQQPPFTLDPAARNAWLRYPFPGNVRELRNIVMRLLAKFPGASVNAAQLEAEFDRPQDSAGAPPGGSVTDDFKARLLAGGFNLDDLLLEQSRCYIEAALDIAQGNMSEAAKLLGIARTTLYSRMEALQKHQANQ